MTNSTNLLQYMPVAAVYMAMFNGFFNCEKLPHLCCQQITCVIPYTAKLSSGKTFAVVHKIHYSLKNFRGASGSGHHVLYTASNSRGKLLRLAENLRKP